jgi:hypothetical protein
LLHLFLHCLDSSMNDLRVLSPGSRILLALACAASVVLLSLYLFFSPFGWDFTDEGFYFNWFKSPEAYPSVATFFGFVYAVPYRLLGENIVALRVVNIISVFVAGAWCVDQAFAGSSRFRGCLAHSSTRYALSFSLAGLSLLGLGKFASPSYNHLALIGCFLVTGALLRIDPLADCNKAATFLLGCPLVFGVVLASLAKPITGLVLGVILLAYALFSRRSARFLILLCLVFSGFVAFAVAALFVGGFSVLLAKAMLAQQWISILDGGHDIKGLAKSVIQAFFYPPFLPFAFVLILQERSVSLLCRLSDQRVRDCGFVSAIVFSVVFLLFLTPLAGPLGRSYLSSLAGTWFFAMPFVFALFSSKDASSRAGVALESLASRSGCGASRLLLILLIPFGYGFGTNTGIWGKALSASLIFISVAAYLLAQLPLRSIRSALSGFLLCYMAGVVLVTPSHASFYLNPQRQPQPLFLNTAVTPVGTASQLRLSGGVSEYIQSARLALARNGFAPGTPFLDWSGQSPGLIYALEGRAVGQAWMVGGYKGSNLLASYAIAKIPCKVLRLSWLVLEPGSPNGLDISILQEFGIDIDDPSLYQKVIELDVPSGVGDYPLARHQVIYKPLAASSASLDCK